MPEGRIRVVFGAVGAHGDALITGGNNREELAMQGQNARLAAMELGANDMAGQAHGTEWGLGMSSLEQQDAQVEINLGEGHHTVVANSSECVQRAISRLG